MDQMFSTDPRLSKDAVKSIVESVFDGKVWSHGVIPPEV